MVTTLNAAKVTDAFRRLLDVSVEEFDELALSAPPGADGLVLVPYLDGERTPNLPDARGSLHGLRTVTTRACFARAAVEGVLCGLLEGGEILARCGVASDGRLILTGGAARSRAIARFWRISPVGRSWISPITETAAAGAAVQAAAALTGSPIAEIAADWAPALEIAAEPDRAAVEASNAVRRAYREAADEAWRERQT